MENAVCFKRPDACLDNLQFGKSLETEFTELIKVSGSSFSNIKVNLAFDTNSDIMEGTDFMVNGLRYDLTADIYSKDHTEILEQTFLIDKGNVVVRFGIRTANRRVQFEQPVIVLGLECEPFYFKNWACRIIESLVYKMDAITEFAEDLFWSWMDSQVPA